MKDELGEEAEIDVLWRDLRRDVSGRTRHADLADDVVQEAWLRTLITPPKERGRLTQWLRVVARRLMWESARAERNRLHRERDAARTELVAGADEELKRREVGVLRLVERMREPYREVVRLRYVEDLKIAEIALRLGRSEGTIRSQLKRGLDQLRRRLIEHGHVPDRNRTLLPAWLAWLPRGRERRPAVEPFGRIVIWIASAGCALCVAIWMLVDARKSGDDAPPSAQLVEGTRERPSGLGARAGAPRVSGRSLADQPADGPRPEGSVVPKRIVGPVALDLRGSVLFRTRQTPVADASIFARDEQGTQRIASSSVDGLFIARIQRFPVWIWAEHAAYAPTRRKRIDRAFAASGKSLVLDTAREGQFNGLVVDPDGHPIPGARIEVRDANEERESRDSQVLLEISAPPAMVHADALGRFFGPLRSVGRTRYDVGAPGYLPRIVYADSLPGEIRIELQTDRARPAEGEIGRGPEEADALATASITGEFSKEGLADRSWDRLAARMRTVTGLACGPGSAHVRGRLVRFDRLDGPDLELRLEGETLESYARITVGEQGAFDVGPLPPGSYSLFVEGGSVHGIWLARRVDLTVDQQLDLGTLTLPHPGSLHAQIEGADAQLPVCVESASLRANGVAVRFFRKTPGSGFEFDRDRDTITIREVWPGEYSMMVEGPGIAATPVDAVVHEDQTTLLAIEVVAAWKTFTRVTSPRRLHSQEKLEVFLRSPGRVVPVQLNAVVNRDDVECVLEFHCGFPDDIERMEVRSSHGLHGELDISGVPKVQGRRVGIRLEERADPEGPPSSSHGR